MNNNNSKIEENIKLLKDFNMNDVEINHILNKSVNIKIDNSIINFDVFLEKDNRTQRNSFHIFFNANTNSIKTSEYIKENNLDFFKFDVFFYLLRRKGNNNLVIDSIKKIFNKKNIDGNPSLTSIDYASDVVKKISKIKSDLKFEQIKFDVPSAFINPTISTITLGDLNEETQPEIASIEYIKKWFEDESKPILVILGKGGVGKTTIAEYFSNAIIDEFKNTSNIFIDSVEIKSRLNKIEENSNISLYDVYKESIKEQNIIDEYYFTKNLEFNNFFIIIDGIDELISKVKNFDIIQFLDSIINYNNNVESSKIIITCRSEYWNIQRESIQLIELKAFDNIQMENFFKKYFLYDSKKYEPSISLAKEFHNNSREITDQNIFHPYALDLITSIINQNIHLKDDLESNHLNIKIKTDYIIAKMCFREKFHSGQPRVTNLSIDEQVKILEYIAIVHNGIINKSELATAVYFGINKNIGDKVQDIDYNNYSESMLSHPLLKYNKDTESVSFAYDFHTDVFKAIYIAYNLSNENLIDEVRIDLLKFIHEFKFGSQIVRDIKIRVNNWSDINISNLSIIIEYVKENNELRDEEKKYLFSGLFNLSYELNKNSILGLTPNKKTNTELIEKLGFKKNNELNHLSLIDIFEEKMLFDFSNVTVFRNCVFNNYSSFWDTSNEWNNNAFFENCFFVNLGKRSSTTEITWIKDDIYSNFDSFSQKNMDNEFELQIKHNKHLINELKTEIEKLVSLFIHFFWYPPNTFYSQNYLIKDGSCRTPLVNRFSIFSSLSITMEEFIEVCEKIEFVEWSYFNKSTLKINVNTKHKSNLKKYIQTNDKPKIVEDLENLLYEKLK